MRVIAPAILSVWLACAAGMNASAEGAAPLDELAQPKLQVRLTGPMQERIDRVIEHWILTAPDANPGMLEMFRLRDRRPDYENPVPWAGEFAGKYLTSAVLLRRMSDDPRLDARVRNFVHELIATQASDGYFGPFPADQRLLGHWDLWGHYHVMLGLYLWYKDTGDREALDAAIRAADLVCNTFLDTGKRVHDAGSHEMNMAIIHILGMLHRETGNARYLRMMREIMVDWERPPAGDYYRQAVARVEFYQTPKPRWESLHPMQGLGEMYRITGYPSYRGALLHFWHSIRRTDIHNAGSFSTNEGAVGNPFTGGAIETCCTVAWLAYSTDALRLSNDPYVANALELATWNTVLGYQHPSGRWCTYNTPMDGKREASAHSIVFQSRPGTPELNCCSVNGPRGLGMISEWAILGDRDGLYVNYYGPGEITATLSDGTAWRFVQETNYPADGAVRMVVTPPSDTTLPLRLRIPDWSKTTTLAVNGEIVPDVAPGGYALLDRTWKPGDVIELNLDMSTHALRGDEYVDYQTSLYHGPILLAYDQKFNAIEPADAPRLDLASLNLQAANPETTFPPIVAFNATAADGTTVTLCDYATAGAHGTYYRSWLPVDNAPPVAFQLRRPANDSVLAAGEVLLQWSGAGPDLRYTVRLATDPAFKNIVREIPGVQGTHTFVSGIGRQDTPLYWNVTESGAQTASANGPWKFTPSQRTPNNRQSTLVQLASGVQPSTGTLELEVDVEAADGPDGKSAIAFNGSTSRAVYTVSPFPVFEYSAAAWINPAELSGEALHEVFSAWCRPSDDPLRLVVERDQIFARIEQHGAYYSTAGHKLDAGVWTHVAVVKQGAELRLYVNGAMAQAARVPEVLETASTAIGIGCNPKFEKAESFHGAIADAVLISRALSDAEIMRLAGN